MADSDNDRKFDTRLAVKLTMRNWNSEFKQAFKNYALTKGEAGEMIVTGVELILQRPNLLDVNANGERIYRNNEVGYKRFEREEKRYEKFLRDKKDLLSALLLRMDREVTNKVQASNGYEAAFAAFNVFAIWQMTEQVCVGRGAVSVYTLITTLLKMKQLPNKYNDYAKEFRETADDIARQGNAQEVLDKIFNTIFILGLNLN
jgi:hypothetical protein